MEIKDEKERLVEAIREAQKKTKEAREAADVLIAKKNQIEKETEEKTINDSSLDNFSFKPEEKINDPLETNTQKIEEVKKSIKNTFEEKKGDKSKEQENVNNATSKIDIISSYTNIKESDKREGIKIYGDKPFGQERWNEFKYPENSKDPLEKKRLEILTKITELEKDYKSTDYVGNKSLIEKEIEKLENELKEFTSPINKKLKTAKELAMEGGIAWDKKNNTETKEENKKISEINKFPSSIEKPSKEDNVKQENTIKKENIIKNTSENTKNESEKNNENKEKYSREELLNAAEIFCKYNRAAYYKDPAGAKVAEERALVELKAGHSEREIEAAIKVASKRNELFGLKDRIKRIKEEYKIAKDNPHAEISTVQKKYEQQIQSIKGQIRIIDNEYNPLLRELAIANLDNQLKNLERFKDHADYSEKLKDAELFKLAMLQTEKVRYQDAKVSANSIINPKGWDHAKNFFKRIGETKLVQGYMKMGKGKRYAVSAAMLGAGVALWLPAAIAAGTSITWFTANKIANALTGGTFGYFLSKKIAQPIAGKAYEHDSARDLKSQQEEAVGTRVDDTIQIKKHWWQSKEKTDKKREEKKIEMEKDRKETPVQMKHFEQLARGEVEPSEKEKILQEMADFNIELCDKYTDKIRRNKKFFIANNVLGTVAAGMLGGQAAQMTTRWLAGPGMLGIIGTHKGGGTINHEPNTNHGASNDYGPNKGSGAGPDVPPGKSGAGSGIENIPQKPTGPSDDVLKAATYKTGEGIEHPFRRQLEMQPKKFGFQGDISDKTAIHKWSGSKADLIAIDQHYKGGGNETWVKDMGPKGNAAYVIDTDPSGKITVQEYFQGKASGTGGLNSPYEYSHSSPRYISALDNTPEYSEYINASIGSNK